MVIYGGNLAQGDASNIGRSVVGHSSASERQKSIEVFFLEKSPIKNQPISWNWVERAPACARRIAGMASTAAASRLHSPGGKSVEAARAVCASKLAIRFR